MGNIWVLIKKDLRFNGKIAIGWAVFVFVLLVCMAIEFHFTGERELDHAFIFYLMLGSTSMTTSQNFNREYGTATKQFLSSLPFTVREAIFAQLILVAVSNIVYTLIMAFGCVITPYMEGFHYLLFTSTLSLAGGGIYVALYYGINFIAAQTFLLGIMITTPYIYKFLGSSMGKWAVFHHWYWLLLIMIAALAIAAVSLILLLKKKKRL